jgi:uncharacterized RDD family membrane protein YckC
MSDNEPLSAQTEPMLQSTTETIAQDLSRARAPGLLRRLATMVYDLLLVFSVLVIAAALFYTLYSAVAGSETITGPARLLFQAYLLAVIAGYYVYFWTGGRQTLGMRAWRTRLLRADGENLQAADALRRLLLAVLTLAPAGAGLLWVLLDRDGLAWYDRLSGPRPVLTVQNPKP